MKDFILNAGEKIISFVVFLSFVFVFLVGVGVASEAKNAGEGILAFVIVMLVGSIYIIITAYFVYWMIDVRSTLKKIEEKLDNLK